MPRTSSVEQEAVRVAIEYLRAQGLRPKDVSAAKVGYDILAGRTRIEVKGSLNDRAQNVIDIRGACELRWNRSGTKVTVTRTGLSFDALIEVTRIGQPDGPVVYYYPKSALEEYGTFWVWTTWRVLVPVKQRGRYQVRPRRARQ